MVAAPIPAGTPAGGMGTRGVLLAGGITAVGMVEVVFIALVMGPAMGLGVTPGIAVVWMTVFAAPLLLTARGGGGGMGGTRGGGGGETGGRCESVIRGFSVKYLDKYWDQSWD